MKGHKKKSCQYLILCGGTGKLLCRINLLLNCDHESFNTVSTAILAILLVKVDTRTLLHWYDVKIVFSLGGI